MELGKKLKQARLEAGLSQRQLCGDTVTRNMLSQIENGTAKPSFATLQALCARLGKPVSYFWEDAPSENLSLLHKAAQAAPQEALVILQSYLSPDPLLDEGYHRLYAQVCMECARQAIDSGRTAYAQTLLEQAAGHANCCDGFDRRQWILLSHQAGLSPASKLARLFPDNTDEMCLRAQAALDAEDPEKALAYLSAADRQPPQLLLLRGKALTQCGRYEEGAQCLCAIEDTHSNEVCPLLEICYREMGNFQKAYEYACKQR